MTTFRRFAVALTITLTLWVLLRGRPRPRDPLVRAWLDFTRRLRRAGLAKAPAEPPLSFGERLAAALPDQADTLRSLSRRYTAWRYAAATLPPDEKVRLIAALRAYRPGYFVTNARLLELLARHVGGAGLRQLGVEVVTQLPATWSVEVPA